MRSYYFLFCLTLLLFLCQIMYVFIHVSCGDVSMQVVTEIRFKNNRKEEMENDSCNSDDNQHAIHKLPD